MNTLDIIILIILSGFAIIGFIRGFIRGAFALGGLIIGVIAANLFYSNIGAILLKHIANEDIANTLAYVIIFLATAIGMVVLGKILSKFVKLILLKWLDRILGLSLGLVKGLIAVSILVMALGMVLPQRSSILAQSQLRPYVESVYTFIPDDFLKKLHDKKKEIEKYIHKNSSITQKQIVNKQK